MKAFDSNRYIVGSECQIGIPRRLNAVSATNLPTIEYYYSELTESTTQDCASAY